MLKKLYDLRRSRKGFTLVELIVVLVILAILAALLIPALTGYIDKAKSKKIVAETRQCVMAAQTLADEYYGSHDSKATFGTNITYDQVKTLAETKKAPTEITLNGDGKVNKLVYDGCTYAVATDGAVSYTIGGKVVA